ncbi:hypothetical protein D8Y22_18785 [Salinadaptatus halalkaliphilus]|uniref:Uncharacterized protein n=2 Tax=Salinadaptatus halalkaliphilus TaxID=2419781 RepID=A0A4S3TKD3_9EURY|nr:hypothetical protein D8Y22_18785 [Salinadaptatus halalkaliphilus]
MDSQPFEKIESASDRPFDAVELTHRPSVASSVVAVAAAGFGALLAGLGSVNGLAIGAVGGAVLGVGLIRGHRTAVDIGALAVFAGVVIGGLGSTAVEPTVLGTIATVLAWDLAHGGIGLGEQLGRESPTRRLEAVLFVSSLSVGLVSGLLGYAVSLVGAGALPVDAVVLLVTAAALLTVALGARRSY